jgi:hypothetical protein
MRCPSQVIEVKASFGSCRALIVDASFIEAPTEQRSPVRGRDGESVNHSRHAREIRATRRLADVDALTIIDERGRIRKSGVGRKWLTLIDLILNRTVIEKVIPAVGVDQERYRVFDRLDELFAIWPDCPVEYLVGRLAVPRRPRLRQSTVRDYGLYIISDPPENQVAPPDNLGFATDQGTPLCTCKNGNGRHKIPWSWDDKNAAPKRRRDRIPAGKPGTETFFRIRWHCPNKKRINGKFVGTGCDHSTTYSWMHWGFVSPLPHAGDHHSTKLRIALVSTRNRVESSYAVLDRMGIGSPGSERADWADRKERGWLLGLGSLWFLISKVIHTPGVVIPEVSVYDAAFAVADELGQTQPTGTAEDDDAGVSAEQKRRGRTVRDALCGSPRPPNL